VESRRAGEEHAYEDHQEQASVQAAGAHSGGWSSKQEAPSQARQAMFLYSD